MACATCGYARLAHECRTRTLIGPGQQKLAELADMDQMLVETALQNLSHCGAIALVEAIQVATPRGRGEGGIVRVGWTREH